MAVLSGISLMISPSKKYFKLNELYDLSWLSPAFKRTSRQTSTSWRRSDDRPARCKYFYAVNKTLELLWCRRVAIRDGSRSHQFWHRFHTTFDKWNLWVDANRPTAFISGGQVYASKKKIDHSFLLLQKLGQAVSGVESSERLIWIYKLKLISLLSFIHF